MLEAGVPDHKECGAILQRCFGDTVRSIYDWNITTEPQIYLNGKSQNLPIGKALGGSSLINGMMFDRGAPGDYDMWEDLGNPGWGWAGLLPYFKKVDPLALEQYWKALPNTAKSETFTPPKPEHIAQFGITYDPSVHGFDGYVQSGYPNFIYPQNSKSVFVRPCHHSNNWGRKFPRRNAIVRYYTVTRSGGKCIRRFLVAKHNRPKEHDALVFPQCLLR